MDRTYTDANFIKTNNVFAVFAKNDVLPPATHHKKKLPSMKLFLLIFVLTCEDNDKLNVAENEQHDHHHQTTAPR